MPVRQKLLSTALVAACLALVGLGLFAGPAELPSGWEDDRVVEARFNDARTRLMIWTDDGFNHRSCHDSDISLIQDGDDWHVSVRTRRTSNACNAEAPITEGDHDAWVDFADPVDPDVTINY